jgi:beta-lactamase class A
VRPQRASLLTGWSPAADIWLPLLAHRSSVACMTTPLRCLATTALALGTTACARHTVPPQAATDVHTSIAHRVAQTPGAIARVVAFRLDGRGPRITILADSLVHAASTMKVPVLIELARRADRGALQLDASIPLENRFASIVDGSRYTLQQRDDSDDSVYAHVGRTVSLRWLATRMITHSSNLATNTLLTVVPADSVTATTRALGATRMLVRRGVEDTPAFRAGLNNVTTAGDLAALLAAIATDRAASPSACAWMRAVLFAQAFDAAIPAGLPPGTRVAHKTGDITRVEHDAGIVYPTDAPPYVLVVLTSGVESQRDAQRMIADITRLVHTEMTR